MSRADSNEDPIAAWNASLLERLVPLGHFRQVHLAPGFPSPKLDLALRVEFPLAEGELVLALIDNNTPAHASEIVLTSRRLYWSAAEAPTAGRRDTRTARPSISAYGMDYALMGSDVRAVPGDDGSGSIELGAGRRLPLHSAEPELPSALASWLREVGAAARAGSHAAQGPRDPELARRVASVLPAVAEASERIRGRVRDIHGFRRDLLAATPRAYVTPLFMVACIAVAGLMAVTGASLFLPSVQDLRTWGGNDAVRVVLHRDYWRLPASVFVHGGIVHLAVNMWFLYSVGMFVERLFGNLAFALIYLGAGVGGALASMATPPVRTSIGASGALFGLLGALLAFLLFHRRSVPASVMKPLWSSTIGLVVFNIILSATIPNIDQAAHLGGLVAGFLGGLLLIPPWPPSSSGRGSRRLVWGVFYVLIMAGVGIAAVRWRETTLPPLARFEDFADQVGPAFAEFHQIGEQLGAIDFDQVDKPETQEASQALKAVAELAARSDRNLRLFAGVEASDGSLQTVRRRAIESQAAQAKALSAAAAYLRSGDGKWLDGPNGVRASVVAAASAELDALKGIESYLRDHQIVRPAVRRPRSGTPAAPRSNEKGSGVASTGD